MSNKKLSFKETLINDKPNLVKQLNHEFNELIKLLTKFSPYKILSHLNTMFKMTLFNIETEHDLDGDSIELKYTLELVQMIFTCTSIDKFEENDIAEEDIYKIIEICNNIYSLKTRYIMAYTYEIYDDDSEVAEYIFESEINSEITGKRYDIFEVEHYVDLFLPLKDYFEDSYGFSIKSLFDGIDKIKRKFMFGINDTRDEMLELMDKCDPEKINEKDRDRFYSLMDEMFGLKLQNVGELTNWPTEFLDILSYEIGENSFSVEEISFEKLYELHKEINRKPLIKLNGMYYYTSMHRLLDNLDRIILKDLYKRNKKDIELIKRKTSENCEELVGKYIRNIIPASEVLTSNYYKIGKKTCENDVLIMFDKYLFIIEVKSGSFTPDVAMNNMKSHLVSLKKLVEDADSQTNRFMEKLEKQKKLEIYESNIKNSPLKKVINMADYNEIFKMVITLEGFNEIEARADKVGILNLNKDIIVCSLDDLKVYSDYFQNNPTQFLHYMTYRRLATHSIGIELNDELDHLDLYIEYNCYPITAKNFMNERKNIKNIFWEDLRRDLDLYYRGRYIGENYIVEKPVQAIPMRLNEIIQYTNNNPNLKNITAIGCLLDMSGNEKENLFNNIEMCINHYINTKKVKYAFINNKSGRLIVLCCIVDNTNYDINVVYDDIYANMKITKSNQANLFFLFYNKDKLLTNIRYVLLTENDERYKSSTIQVIVEKIKENRFNKRINQNGRRKIGRNELCPCGSGIKYKKCCGR